MHLVGVRRTLADRHPWLPGAVFKAFEKAKEVALAQLSDTSATKVTLPFVEERLIEAHTLMGEDFWSYGARLTAKHWKRFCGTTIRKVCRPGWFQLENVSSGHT